MRIIEPVSGQDYGSPQVRIHAHIKRRAAGGCPGMKLRINSHLHGIYRLEQRVQWLVSQHHATDVFHDMGLQLQVMARDIDVTHGAIEAG